MIFGILLAIYPHKDIAKKNEVYEDMVSIIRIVEWLTKTTLMGLFHIWYLLGCWLSLYITIDETNEDHPLSFSFDGKNTWHDRRKEDKTISTPEEIL